MAFLNKLMFWKKKEDSFDDLTKNADSGMPVQDDLGLDQKPLGLDEQSPFPDASAPANPTGLPDHLLQPASTGLGGPAGTPPTAPAGSMSRDLELISSKLDTLKAILSSMEQRIANLEKAAGIQQKEKLW